MYKYLYVYVYTRWYAWQIGIVCDVLFLECCSALQCVAVCRNVLQCVSVCCSVLRCDAYFCCVLQRGAACCCVLLFIARSSSGGRFLCSVL